MRIAILGIGAMGSLFGAKLSPHADVTLIGHWREQIAALKAAPIRIIFPDDSEREVPLTAIDYASATGPYDIALILTKSAGTVQAAECAARILAPEGLAITLQNGLGNLEIIARHVGEARAILGVTTQGAAIDVPGMLRVGGVGSTVIAEPHGHDERLHELGTLMNEAGLTTELAEDVSTLVWGKLAVNAAINPLTAVLRVRNGALLNSPNARTLMADAAREVAAVAAALGIDLPFDAAARAEEVAYLTAPNRSSMLADVLRGAPTEIEAINGAVIRKSAEFSIPTPVNTMLYHLVKALEATAASRI